MTCDELRILQKEAQRVWLHGWWLLMETENCLAECNGCGAEWMPKWARKFFDWLLRLFAPAIAIHDRRYGKNEGDRHYWDDEFEINCRIIARRNFGEYNLLRYFAYWVARRLRVALTVAGEIAWQQCKKEKDNSVNT